MTTTFVLITGAWHGGWAWRPVAQELRAAGCRVITPTLPGLHDGDDPAEHSLADVVDYVVDRVDASELSDVTLVGHEGVPPPYQELFTQVAHASGNNSVTLPFEVWQSAFINDASEDVQRLTYSLMVPQPFQYFTDTIAPLDAQAAGIPVSYVLSSADIALPPGEYGWHRFADRLGVAPITTPGSHEACFTQPATLAEAFLKA
jgi:hypothetical protein